MHHSLKFALCTIIFTTIVASSCSVFNPSVSFSEISYENEKVSVSLQMPEFKNFNNVSFAEELNNNYKAAVKKQEEDFLLKSEKSSLKDDKCVLTLVQEIKMNSCNLMSVVGEVYSYTDGIHGSSTRIVKNIDTLNGTELKLCDLFSDESYENLLNREISEILEENAEQYHDLWEKPIISSIHQNCFYFSNDGLVIFYPPYELSYYARGFVEFCIPYLELSGYLKDEYKFLTHI